ncbi:uncharacterized protein with ParB-like and HNH nuclease domain [Ereboglobus sp. PH5-5]|uniref:DUF262 domain-containing protein n=1 Tax=Ereboglobus sp. PH5-5 TaxID=2940529 RepID=UPI0024062DD7|nr:DUF262 domain-containing HNH endonuclease family protein [Ereboglobus sp. PH5-5]MDF9833632.1 uncharacterized protein with ParB-like and HNH nuclease domain [Ereboglobus sp. PH5-5]
MKITPASLTITQLLSSTNELYAVPAYQRRYSWHEKQLNELIADIDQLENNDTHLLGSIVCLTSPHTAGLNELEVVDGQQRITTVCIILSCIKERLIKEDKTRMAQEIESLLQAKAFGESPVRKIRLGSLDAEGFDQLVEGKSAVYQKNQSLENAFKICRDWMENKAINELEKFLYRLVNQALIIRLEVNNAKDAFKLFETINNRGLKLSATDIIKNFILGNAARFGYGDLNLARNKWAELLKNLDGVNIETFFRHYLCAQLKSRITASYVIIYFKRLFMKQVSEARTLPKNEQRLYLDVEDNESDDDSDATSISAEDILNDQPNDNSSQVSFSEFMENLTKHAKHYSDVIYAKTGNAKIDRHLRNLKGIKATQTYGFLMSLRVSNCSDKNFIEVLKLTESFLMRRHICKRRANENESAFARLCGVDGKSPQKSVIEEYRKLCPPDAEFLDKFFAFDFTSNLIERARYCLTQFETLLQGDHLELLVGGPDIVHVEHIIPQKIRTKKSKDEFGDWVEYLGESALMEHEKYVSRIGNMTLFSGELNMIVSNNPYERKKTAYRRSSIKITNALPDDYSDFRFIDVEKRSRHFSELAVKIWPIP